MSYKIFLSPSNQKHNYYKGVDTNESEQMKRVADYCRAALMRCGFDVMLQHDKDVWEKAEASDRFNSDLYIPIHSNACNGEVSGTRMFCYSKPGKGYDACLAIFNKLAPVTPGTSENIKVDPKLFEVYLPKAPTAYIEVDFHDVPSVARWIVDNAQLIGEKIAEGVCDYFGVRYNPPVLYRVQVGAFSNKENAAKYLKEVQTHYPNAFIVEVK